MSCSSKSKLNAMETDHLGYVGIWPSNGKDAKVVPMGTPGIPLTDIYDEMMHSNGQKGLNKASPIGDHPYPIPVPVPVITPRTRDLARSVIQGGNKSPLPGSQAMMNSVSLKPKRRSFESLRNKSQPPQQSGAVGSRRSGSKFGSGSGPGELSRSQRPGNSAAPNRRSLASLPGSTANPSTGSRLRRSANELGSGNSGMPSRGNNVTPSQKNSLSNSGAEKHKIPEDYVPRSSLSSCYSSCSGKNAECPVVPYPYSVDAEDGALNDSYSFAHYQPQERFPERPANMDTVPLRSPARRVSQNGSSSVMRNSSVAAGPNPPPFNSNMATHHRDYYYPNYGDAYYNREELYPNPYYKRSSSLDRPTFTNTSSLNPLDSCIPQGSSSQYNAESLNCYSVPNKYRNSVHNLTSYDTYADSATCLSPSKTLMYCSGEYGALEAEKHVRQNYSAADEVFKPMIYETIVFPPGYFEYKKQLEELRRKYILDTNPNAFYQMKQNGEFVDYKTNRCMWKNTKATNKKRSHPVFVKTTGTIDHLNRTMPRPNPACYC